MSEESSSSNDWALVTHEGEVEDEVLTLAALIYSSPLL